MRIATWNVNSLKARMPAVEKWLEKASPDVLLMQETKLANEQVPELPFQVAGYEVAHHGEGRWNGVAVASRVGISDLVTNFGDGPVRDSRARSGDSESEDDFNPFDEARMMSVVCGGVRFVSLYAPNGRVVGSPFYEGKLLWFERLHRWLMEERGRRTSPSSSAATSTRLRPMRMCGTRPPPMAGPMCRSRSEPHWLGCETGVWSMRFVAINPAAVASPGGTTGRECSRRTWG